MDLFKKPRFIGRNLIHLLKNKLTHNQVGRVGGEENEQEKKKENIEKKVDRQTHKYTERNNLTDR